MTKQPLISVIIPVYNVEKYLPDCLDSVLAQTFKDFEVIAIDDGSPDGCGKILDEYAAKDERVKVFHQENRGEAMARNRGLDTAAGEYIYFVDNDDFIHPQTLEVLYHTAEKYGFGAAACRHSEIHERQQPPMAVLIPEQLTVHLVEKPLQKFLDDKKTVAIAPWCKLYKKSLIGESRFVKGIHFDDVPFNLMMLSKLESLPVVEENLYFFYQNSLSVSHSSITLKKVGNYITIVESIYEYMNSLGDEKMLRQVQQKCLPGYVNTVMGAVSKMRRKNPELYAQMLPVLKEGIERLFAQKMVLYRDFKLRKKWAIFKLLRLSRTV